MRWLKYLAYTLLSGFLLLVLVSAWGLSTETGLHWLTAQAQRLLPGELKIDSLQGRLLGQMELRGVSYRQDELAVELARAKLAWHPSALFRLHLDINALEAEDIRVQLPPAAESSASGPLQIPELDLPLSVALERADIRKLRIDKPGAAPIIIDHIELQAELDEQLRLRQLAVQALQGQAELSGEFGLRAPHPLQLALNWQAELPPDALPPATQARGKAQLAGDLQQLTLQHELLAPLRTELHATLSEPLQSLQWQAVLQASELAWPLEGEAQVQGQGLRLAASGDLQNYRAELNTRLSGAQIPPGQWQLLVQGDLSQARIEQLQARILGGTLRAEADIGWADQLSASARLNLETLHLGGLPLTWPQGVNPDELILNGALQAAWQDQNLKLQELTLGLAEQPLQLSAQGDIDLTDSAAPRFDVELAWEQLRWPLDSTQPAQAEAASGGLALQGQAQDWRAQLTTALAAPQLPESEWQIQAKGDLQQATLERLHADLLQGELSGTAQARWQPQLETEFALNSRNIRLDALWAEWPQALSLATQIQGRFAAQQLALQQVQIQVPESGAALELRGDIDLRQAQPAFDLQAEWQQLRWPLQGDSVVAASERGQLQVQGRPDAYEMELSSQLHGQNLPQTRLQARGQGDSQQLQLQTLRADLLDGTLNLNGSVRWAPSPSWALQLDGENINPGQHWRDWPGKLALALRSEGRIDEKLGLQVDAQLDKLAGRLRDYPLQLSTRAEVRGEQYQLSDLQLRAGKASLQADVQITDKLQGEWTLDVPSLAELLPDAKGKLSSRGQLGGTLQRPQAQASLQGRELALAELALRKADAELSLDLQRGEDFNLRLQAEQLQQGEQTLLASLVLEAEGSAAQHAIRLQAEKSAAEKLHLQLQGALDLAASAWRGQLSELQATLGPLGTWATPAPVALSASPARAELANFCLHQQAPPRGEPGRWCADAAWVQNGASLLTMNIEQLPLGLLNPFLAEQARLDGVLSGELQTRLGADRSLRGAGTLRISPGELRALLDDRQRRFAHRGGQLQWQIGDDGLQAELGLDLFEQSLVKANLSLAEFRSLDWSAEQPIAADLVLDFADMRLLSAFVAPVKKASGAVALRASVGGTLLQPKVRGKLEVKELAADIPDLGLNLSEFNLLAEARDGEVIDVRGGLRSGAGRLNLDGQIFPGALTDWKSVIHLQGEQLEVINTADVRAEISPDLYVTALPGQLILRGDLLIPQADITPNIVIGSTEGKVGDAVAISRDARIINPLNPEQQSTAQSAALDLDIHLRIKLGQRIHLAVVGFQSRLGGNLDLIKRPEGKQKNILRGEGEVQIIDGIYRAYGQDLEIDRGRIIFTGGPLENPGLNITAVRRIHTTPGDYDNAARPVSQAGVRISGRAQQPRLNLFSEPMLEDAEILSYILTGRGLGGDMSSLSLGTYLSDKFYVSGGISLFDQTKTFNLRYEISDRWGLEGVIGDRASGADISYTLGR